MMTVDQIDQRLAQMRAANDAPALPENPLVLSAFNPIPPHLVGVYHLLLKPRFLIADPTGTGKTPQVLVAYAHLKQREARMGLLVLALKSSLFQWRGSVKKFLGPSVSVEVVGWNPSCTRRAIPAYRRLQYDRFASGEIDVLIGNYHTVLLDFMVKGHADDAPKGKRAARIPVIPDFGQFVLALDEIQAVRERRGSLLHPGAKALSERARCVWGMTATPIMHRLDDLYAIYEVLRPGTFGDYKTFASDFYTRILRKIGKRRFWKVTGTKNLPTLMQRIRPFYLRRAASDISKYLPGVQTRTMLVEMEPAQEAFYKDVVKKFQLPEGDVTSDYPTAQRMGQASRLRAHVPILQEAVQRGATPEQLADHLHTEPEVIKLAMAEGLSKLACVTYAQLAADAPETFGANVPNAKLDELARYLLDDVTDEKVIVFSRFEQVVTAISRRLTEIGIPWVRITGKESVKAREEARVSFQTRSDTRVILINSAGGTSLDLQAANVVVFYDMPWSPGELMQVLGRARRIGSPHESVQMILLGTHDTIDISTLTLLQQKERLFDDTFGLNTDDVRLSDASFETTPLPSPAQLFSDSTLDVTSASAGFIDELYRQIGWGESAPVK